jgi:hypothetical protein
MWTSVIHQILSKIDLTTKDGVPHLFRVGIGVIPGAQNPEII